MHERRVFGLLHRYSWGWDLRLPGGWLVWSRIDSKRLFLSRDGTPTDCLTLFRGR